MKYRNPPLPEATQPTDEGRGFLTLMAGAGLILGALIVALSLLSDWLAPSIPFATEQVLLASSPNLLSEKLKPENGPAAQALQTLAQRVAANMDLPAGMSVTVHYLPAPTVNAFATLGGHVYVYRGLIEKLASEDALAFVLAHEMGHVKERHVIRGMSRGLMVVAALSAVGIKSSGINQWALGKGAEIGGLAYSRDAESAADIQALHAVCRGYGHAGGASEVFGLFARLGDGGLEMLHSHPLSEHRQAEMLHHAQQAGCPAAGAAQPLAAELLALRTDAGRNTPAASRRTGSD